MRSVKIEKGVWRGKRIAEDLYFEDCPECGAEGLHYPKDLTRPYCPHCSDSKNVKTILNGYELVEKRYARVDYHLGA